MQIKQDSDSVSRGANQGYLLATSIDLLACIDRAASVVSIEDDHTTSTIATVNLSVGS